MKYLLLVCVLAMLVKSNDFLGLSSREVETYIRTRGTISIAAVHFHTKTEEEKTESELLLNSPPEKVNLFNN